MEKTENNKDDPRYPKSGYFFDTYDKWSRFCGYWHQIDRMREHKPEKMLEVGIGNGFVSNYFRRRGWDITTVDVRDYVKPDIVASVLDMPFDDNSFDLVACCEVLEHLDYENFSAALSEIRRVTKTDAVISVPDVKRVIELSMYILGIGTARVVIPFFGCKKKKQDYHRWEIGRPGWRLKRIKADITKAGFDIKKTFRARGNLVQRFFILKKV